ncbi:hypothetical protein [Paenibacillus periandrae]|uniref:hypothetical protein n=1 Tax=Paenibacillus periandrae TaxID=1761741 RepID=UPI001F08C7CF|nr:hypothetical protein [Paenibacillus periandrae]
MSNNNVYKKSQNEKAVLKIEYDTDVISPRIELDNLGTMVCWHRRYNVGDEHNHVDADSFFIYLLEEMDLTEETYHRISSQGKSRNDLLGVLERQYVILPIYGYDHGNLMIQTTPYSCPWDSGQLGWIYVSKKDIRKEYGVKRVTTEIRERVLSVLRGEVATYDQYLLGDIYGYIIEDNEGNHIDSCWGFYGSDPNINGMAAHIPEEYADLIKEVA